MNGKLYFITPAWQRYQLSQITFACRAWAIDKLKAGGIDAQCVVIADDDNLDIARGFGFLTVERDNKYLGRRFNDGWEQAQLDGATHGMPVGSDTWIDPQWILAAGLPEHGHVLANRNYALVHRDGTRRSGIWIPVEYGVHFVLPMSMIEQSEYRPTRDSLAKGCDTATIRGLMPGYKIDFSEAHRLEAIAFQSRPQITNYNTLRSKWGTGETLKPFDGLDLAYPSYCVGAIESFYATAAISEPQPISMKGDKNIERAIEHLTERVDDLQRRVDAIEGGEHGTD